MTCYIDLVILLNFLTDLLLLLGTNRLMGFPSRLKQLIPAALLGALYSAACMIPSLFFLGTPLWSLIFLCLISLTAFGFSESALRRGALFLLLSMALGGMALAIHQAKFHILLLEALALWLLTRISFGSSKVGTGYLPIRVATDHGTFSFTALADTGNQLKDPLTGEPVLVVAPREAQLLTGLSLEQLAHPLSTMVSAPLKGLRLIPYEAVGKKGGMMLCMRFPKVEIGKHTGPALLAFAFEGLGSSTYQALAGGGFLC